MRVWLVLLLLGLVTLAAASPQRRKRDNQDRNRDDEDLDGGEREDDDEDNDDGSRSDRRSRDEDGVEGDRDEEEEEDDRPRRREGGPGRRGGRPGGDRNGEDEDEGEDDECREARLDSKRAFCRKAVVIVDEATECADATGAVEFISPQEICTNNAGQNVYMCRVKGRREVMELVEPYIRSKLGEEAGRREIRDELCSEEADFKDLDLSTLKIEEGTSKRCIACP